MHKEYPSVLIVTHNHIGHVERLIESCSAYEDLNFYIRDAASTDGTPEKIAELIRGKTNIKIDVSSKLYSFSKNNNDLIKKYRLENSSILLINPDCYFDKNALYQLINETLKIENLGVLAPEIKNPDGSVQYSWRKFPSVLNFLKKRLFKYYHTTPGNNHTNFQYKGHDKIFTIDWALGALLYIDKSLNNNGNILDERYRLYCEDADICFHSKMMGKEVLGIRMDGFYHHLQQKSTYLFSKYSYWNFCSAVKFFLKWNIRYLKRK